VGPRELGPQRGIVGVVTEVGEIFGGRAEDLQGARASKRLGERATVGGRGPDDRSPIRTLAHQPDGFSE
jgi:hypothetical protein